MHEERKIILYFKDYHSSDDITHQQKIDVVKDGVERGEFFKYVGKMLTGKEFSEITNENREVWKKISYLVDECIEDNYLRQEDRYTESPAALYDLERGKIIEGTNKVLDGQFLFLTSKGKKLIRWSYFYFKYLPEEFSDFKIILITVLSTIITHPIWKPLISWVWSGIHRLSQ